MLGRVANAFSASRSPLTAPAGIGLEFARKLLEHGANVLFADLALRPEAEALVSQYQSRPKAVFQRTDVTSWPDLDEMFKAAERHFGSIDIVCPGAGVFEPPWSNFWIPPGTGASQDDPAGSSRYRLLDINVTHPIRVTQLAIAHFLAASPPVSPSNPKSIVHIASIAGETASLPFPLYHASKHAIDGFVRSLADLEHTHGIRVSGVEPGVVKTPLWLDNPEKLQVVDEKKDTWVTPEEVAEVMLALVKDNEIDGVIGAGGEGKGAKGQKIPIRGGTLLEVLAGAVRDVPTFNNVGPYAGGQEGASISDGQKLYTDVLRELKPGWGRRV